MSIGFNAIPVSIRTPGNFIEFDSSRAVSGLPGQPHRALLIGHRLASGVVEAGVVTQVLSSSGADAAFGAGSQLAAMARAFRGANPRTELHAIAIDDAENAVAATGTVAFTGTPTQDGVVSLYVGGQEITVAATKTTASTVLATALAAAVNARDFLPVSATVGTDANTHVVTLTSKWKGLSANAIDIQLGMLAEPLPDGLTVDVSAMSGGLVDDDLSTTITALGDRQFHTIACGLTSTAPLATLAAELDRRWGPMVMAEGHAFIATTGTFGEMSAVGGTLNSRHISLMGAGKSPTAPWVWAAVIAAVDAAEPDPARPRQTLALQGVWPPAPHHRLTRDERDLLLHSGVATHVVGDDGVVRIERLITTYQTSATGALDSSFLDIETLRTLSFLRYDLRNSIALRYPRHKLASDDARFGPGQPVVTPGSLRTHILVRFGLWESAGLVEGFEQFKAELLVQRSESDPNRVDAVIPPDLMNQFRVFAGQVQFLL